MNSFKKSASFSPCSKNVNKDSLGFNYCFEYALFVFRIDKEKCKWNFGTRIFTFCDR